MNDFELHVFCMFHVWTISLPLPEVTLTEDASSSSGHQWRIQSVRSYLDSITEEKRDPTYFKLKKDETTACLATDFGEHNATNNTAPFNGIEATRIQDDKYFSLAVLDNDGKCPTEGSNTCKGVPGGDIESDPKLNFLSLSVLGLRVLFFKTIVFNVVMTVRVWMR